MPLSTQTLTWETVASFGIHLLIPFVFGLGMHVTGLDPLRVMTDKRLLLPWAVLFIVVSFFVHFGFLSRLQIEACSGIKDWAPIGLGALKAIAITLLFVVPPVFSEWIRLLISQVVIRHLPLAAPGQEQINTVTVRAADDVEAIATELTPPTGETVLTGIGGVLGEADYLRQTFSEMRMACAYMSAFGGAIGFAVGSWGVANCRGGDRKKA